MAPGQLLLARATWTHSWTHDYCCLRYCDGHQRPPSEILVVVCQVDRTRAIVREPYGCTNRHSTLCRGSLTLARLYALDFILDTDWARRKIKTKGVYPAPPSLQFSLCIYIYSELIHCTRTTLACYHSTWSRSGDRHLEPGPARTEGTRSHLIF